MELSHYFEDIRLLQNALELAKGNSVGNNIQIERVVRTVHIGNVKEITAQIIGFVLVGALAVGGVKLIDKRLETNDPETDAKSIIYNLTTGESESIVSSHTDINPQNQSVNYQHNKISLDLIKLSEYDSLFFDYAFGDVCNSMGPNLNKITNTGRSNIDEVIYNLKALSQKGSYVDIEFEDINSLDEYLIKHNYVTNGKPDYEKFLIDRKSMVNDIVTMYEIIKGKEGNKK